MLCEYSKCTNNFKQTRSSQRFCSERCRHAAALVRYRLSDKGKAANKRNVVKYQHSEKGQKARNKASILSKQRYPDRVAARKAVYNAKRDGLLICPSICSNCFEPRKVNAHHHKGYTEEFWLDVIWLCSSCHRDDHAKD